MQQDHCYRQGEVLVPFITAETDHSLAAGDKSDSRETRRQFAEAFLSEMCRVRVKSLDSK